MSELPPVTTTLLLARLRDGRDQEAWAEFDERFRGVILSAALRLGLKGPDAEEAAQETMLQAFRDYQQGRYDRARGRLSSWIIGIAHHRIVDIQRRHQRERGLGESLAGADCEEAAVTEAFDYALERRIFEVARAWVRSHTQSHDDSLRVFELTAMRGVPLTEAATQCGMSVEQVYVARSRIAGRLRDAVERIERAYRDGL